MGPNGKAFGKLLTQGLRQIKAKTGIKLSILEDDLSYEIGKESGGASTIGFFRRGNIPADPLDVLHLAQEITKRKGFDQEECRLFLTHANYPNPQETAQLIFRQPPEPPPPPERPMHPYIVGPPIENPQQFYGRHQELKQIFDTLNRQPLQHFAIIGLRRSGKSSLLKYIRNIC